ncbi:MAG TPA: hypothetical protein VK846_09305, partial [Candidatus Limnocylindria bacterium]|nr:hypothetical protein [Candidatus Limnocylindria bacterium]
TFSPLLPQLRAEAERADFIVAETLPIGGNLRLNFPNKTVLTPQFTPERWRNRGQTCLIVFDATRKPQPPAALQRLIALETGLEPTEVQWSHAEARPSPDGKPIRFAFARVTVK